MGRIVGVKSGVHFRKGRPRKRCCQEEIKGGKGSVYEGVSGLLSEEERGGIFEKMNALKREANTRGGQGKQQEWEKWKRLGEKMKKYERKDRESVMGRRIGKTIRKRGDASSGELEISAVTKRKEVPKKPT